MEKRVKKANKLDKVGISGDKSGKKAEKVVKTTLTQRLWDNYKATQRKCHHDDL